MTLVKVRSRGINLADNFAFTGTISGAGGGKINQVVSTNKATINSFSSSNTNTFVDLGISVSITPSATSSKVLIVYNAHVAQTTSATIHVQLLRDSTVINYNSDLQGSQLQDGNSFRFQGTTPYDHAQYMAGHNFLDSPNSTSSLTYKLRGTLGGSYSGTYYVGRGIGNDNSDFSTRLPHNITAFEVLAWHINQIILMQLLF